MPLSRHSVGICPESSSHATRQGTLGHNRLSSLRHRRLILAERSGISVRDLISTLKKRKKEAHAGNELSNILQKHHYMPGKNRHQLVCEIFCLTVLIWIVKTQVAQSSVSVLHK